MSVTEIFGSMTFNDSVMRERLPRETYKALKRCIAEDTSLTPEIANVIANAMKDWAVEKGATHYTHWFQPLTGITAEKHDSFITPAHGDGIRMEFSGKNLIKGEPDASSFPNGGIRATFEARGYTAWDPTSYAFIKDGVLCIPTAFCSYTGEALDKKTPLLRSMEALNTQSLRILKLFGDNETKRVTASVGAEQEYFLIDSKTFAERKDLLFTGRTLFGARPPKGQELDDHYFGAINARVSNYMRELDEELWKLGILAKTKHNEVAPSQHELAPIFTSANIATDQNQMIMEIMKKVAARHGLTCLLHEKPFAGVNGSGKHDNWSLTTDTKINLLEPGNDPQEDARFLLFLVAVIKAVDEYQDLLRISVSSASNDHRLGANEAPPAIISIYLGEELDGILNAIAEGRNYSRRAQGTVEVGVHVLPCLPKDSTDRNRTSPFAFTGNKFELRMSGSSQSIADPNTVLNTIVAEELKQFADELEKANDFTAALQQLIQKVSYEHRRIVFNGNNYSDEWINEAEKRGLLNLKSTPDALKSLSDEKNIKLFSDHNVLTKTELLSRQEVFNENYCKVVNIEALTMLDMVSKDILPAVTEYLCDLTKSYQGIIAVKAGNNAMLQKINTLNRLYENCVEKTEALEAALLVTRELENGKAAHEFCYKVLPAMRELRAVCDEMEVLTARKYWPFPSYSDLLFGVR